MPASIVELAEWVKGRLTDSINTESGAPTATVERRWSVPTSDKDLGKIEGRKVEIWHSGYGTGADVTREKSAHSVTLSILVAERWKPGSGAAGEPDNDWIDALVVWVEQYIYSPLTETADTREEPAGLILGNWWVESAEMVTVCDAEILRSHLVFWSEISVVFGTQA